MTSLAAAVVLEVQTSGLTLVNEASGGFPGTP